MPKYGIVLQIFLHKRKQYAIIKLMKEGKEKANHKSLWLALILLFFVIIILVVINILIPIINTTTPDDSNSLVKDCLQSEDINVLTDCIEAKVDEYTGQDDCAQALKVYDDIPVNRFDPYTLQDLYDQAYSLSIDCEDGAQQEYWKEKSESLSNQLEGRD